MPTPSSPEAVVQQSIDAYNAHDLDAYIACWAPDATLGQIGGRVLLDGRDALTNFYSGFFATQTTVRLTVKQRSVIGPFVVEHHEVQSEGKPPLEAMMVTEVRDNLIRAVWYSPLTDAPHPR